QPVVAERDLGTAPGLAGHAPALLLAVLHFLRHQHRCNPRAGGAGRAGRGCPSCLSGPSCPSCPISRARRRPSRGPLAIFLFSAPLGYQALTLIEPALDSNLPVCRVRFRETVVDVGTERLQRQLTVQVPLGARDLGAVQAARDTDLDAARAEAQRRLDRLAHGATERDALLELHRDRLGDELRVELGLLNLLDVDEDLAARALLDFLLQLVDFGALAADDDARARRVDVDLQLVRGALGLDLGDARVGEPLLQALAQREILVQQLRVVAIRVPARPPRLVEAEAESKRVNLLAHSLSFIPCRVPWPSPLSLSST